MKIVVFGTSEFAVPVLEAVAGAHDVVGVVTQPDRPAGRGQKLVATPVSRAAQARGLRVLTPAKLRPFVDDARALGADAFVVASYGKIVPQALLDLVPVAFNVHPSLLPLYRGATPLQSAIRDGRTQTGVTIIAMDAGMDTGDVLLQEPTPLRSDETYGELHDRLAGRGAALVVDALAQYARGTLLRKPQSDVARKLDIGDAEIAATATRPLRKDDLLLDWTQPARRIVDHVRSLAPSPAARTNVKLSRVDVGDAAGARIAADADYEPVKVLAAHVERGMPAATPAHDSQTWAPAQRRSAAPGVRSDLSTMRMLYGFAGDGDAVVLDRVVPPGRAAMSGPAYVRSVGDRLANVNP